MQKARDKHDDIIVTEKLDGSCVAIANIGGHIVALGRAGYLASTSKFEQHVLFADWVSSNRDRFDAIPEGHRVVGEWLAQAHGTRYQLTHDPFVMFALMYGEKRLNWDDTQKMAETCDLTTPRLLFRGGPFSLESAKESIQTSGHGALDPVEGAVWRVERKGQFDFIAKWVRPDKKDGAYLPEVSGSEAFWNWRPTAPS